jgi:hypothetical protein
MLGELRDATEAFLNSRQVTLPTYADQNGNSRQAMIAALGLDGMAYPTTLVLDQQGAIRGFWQGYHASAAREMSDLIERLLDQPPDAQTSD